MSSNKTIYVHTHTYCTGSSMKMWELLKWPENPCFYWRLIVMFMHFHTYPYMKPVKFIQPTISFPFSQIHLNTVLQSICTCLKMSVLRFCDQSFIFILCYVFNPFHPFLNDPNNISWRIQIINLLLLPFS